MSLILLRVFTGRGRGENMTFKVIEERLPVYWGSFLVNNDESGLEPDEMPTIDRTLQFLKDSHES